MSTDALPEITQYLLRFSRDALVVVDPQGQIRFANETVFDLFGHDPRSLIGRSIEVLVPERFRNVHGLHIDRYVSAPSNREMGARMSDLFALRADGSEFAAGIRLAPFRIGDKQFVAAAIRDTTERRVINEKLVEAREEADRANRAKSRFLATASHDLRQPMQTIRLLNAAMLRMAPQLQLQELLKQQEQAIEGMTHLLNSLLDISRLESGAVEPIICEISLAEVLMHLRAEFQSLAAVRNIELRIDASSTVVATDRTLLTQLLQNLLGNALKYTDRGCVSLKCAREQTDLVIKIEDTGVGIPADKLDRVFDEYYQVDTHGAKRMGVGLGLAIVKEVARLLDFSVSITSKLGQGTQAQVRIPGRMIVAAKTAPASISPPALTQSHPKPRLLLVEDNDGVRLATETFLKLEGYDISSAASFAEGQKLFVDLGPTDVLIADYHLDDQTTGLEMLLTLRSSVHREVPAVILSGDLPSVLRTLRAPVANCAFLSKPVDVTELIHAIEALSASPPH